MILVKNVNLSFEMLLYTVLSRIYALSSVKFFGLKLRLCKKRTNIRYARTSWPGCAVVGNKFIVAGGVDDYYNDLKSTEIIDLHTRSIIAGGGMEKPRSYFHLLSIRGTLYALGGQNYDEIYSNLADVEEFVEETGTWKPATSLSGARSDYGGVAVNLDLICG